MTDHPGYIYVIDLKPMGLPGYKIGMTKHLKNRLRQLEVPEKGTLCKWWYVNNVRACEKALHKLFPNHRVPQSEWFKINEDQLKQVRSTVREWKKNNSLNAPAVVVPTITNVISTPDKPRSENKNLVPFVAGFALCFLVFAAGAMSTNFNQQRAPYPGDTPTYQR